MIEFRRILVCLAISFAFAASPSIALPARVVHGDILQLLSDLPAGGRVTLRNVELGRESLDHLELEPMEVWAKDAKILVHGPAGEETIIPPPDVRYFKGRVAGEEDSVVFVSMSADGSVRGMVMIGDRRWTMGTGVRKSGVPRKGRKIDEAPILITENDPLDDAIDPASNFQCDVGRSSSGDMILHRNGLKPQAEGKAVIPNAGNVSGATYQLRVAVETDNELSAAFGNNATAINTYVGDIVGKTSVIYSRDVSTTLVLGFVDLWTGGPGTDPWTFGSSPAGLAQFGTYWHNNFSLGYPAVNGGTVGGGTTVARSSAVFLSGQLFGSGIAWIDVLCGDNFFCLASGNDCGGPTYANAYGGAYAFNSSFGSVTTTNPDPTATVNGVQYGIPLGSDYWMLLELTHEFGHNVASPHSSCIPLSALEQATYGVARSFVDNCLSGETNPFPPNSPCYSGSLSAPSEKGSIMSYCHNIFYSGSFRASRYLIGKAGEPSEKMLTIFKNGFAGTTGLEGCTANPTITTQTQPVACSAGRTASVATCSGCTYAWQISGGTINTSTTISSITYTPTQPSVTLTVTVITARGCGITASKTITTQCVAVSPPTGVTATATSTTAVQVSWTASAGAASYNVYRSVDGINYSLAGSTITPTVTFSDTGRTANTAYLYKVRAVSGTESADSNRDLATTTIFTDDPLVQFTTLVKAAHITQLRTAVDAVRALAGIGAGSYTTDPTITVGTTTIKAAHINELRTALDAARSTLTLSALSYGETVTQNVTTIKLSHITELRNGVK
jgi:hypothetical protein